nr:hypothetical protein [Microbispora cellulosiformans]
MDKEPLVNGQITINRHDSVADLWSAGLEPAGPESAGPESADLG